MQSIFKAVTEETHRGMKNAPHQLLYARARALARVCVCVFKCLIVHNSICGKYVNRSRIITCLCTCTSIIRVHIIFHTIMQRSTRAAVVLLQ